MDNWCVLQPNGLMAKGTYHEARVTAKSGAELHHESGFVAALAEEIMGYYEGRGAATLQVLSPSVLRQRRSRRHYARLVGANGTPNEAFETVASEVLGWWLERSLGGALCADLGVPNNNDPAFDVLALWRDATGYLRLRIVQVKATKANLQGITQRAMAKFGKLEAGEYAAELDNRLDILIDRCGAVWSGDDDASGLYWGMYGYRVTAIHGDDRDAIEIMTTFDQHVADVPDVAPEERRSTRLILINWDEFWRAVWEVIDGELG